MKPIYTVLSVKTGTSKKNKPYLTFSATYKFQNDDFVHVYEGFADPESLKGLKVGDKLSPMYAKVPSTGEYIVTGFERVK